MTDIIIAYFNGTPLSFPYKTSKTELFALLDENVKEYDSDWEFYLEQTKDIEKQLFELSGGRELTIDVIAKVADKLGQTWDKLTVMWFLNIKYLLDKGVIKDDNNNGFLVIGGDKKTVKRVRKIMGSVCIVCKKEAKHKCSKCGLAQYCCKEHQVENWKEHKKYCGKL